jgi:chromosome segregation and condensation protein ScpB
MEQAVLERLDCILFNLSRLYSLSRLLERTIMKTQSRRKKRLVSREKELSKRALELKELEVALRFTTLNSKLTVMEHYQQPKGVNYR